MTTRVSGIQRGADPRARPRAVIIVMHRHDPWWKVVGVIVGLPLAGVLVITTGLTGVTIIAVSGVVLMALACFRVRTALATSACNGCGYDLTLNDSGTCPECGGPAVQRLAFQWDWGWLLVLVTALFVTGIALLVLSLAILVSAW